MKHSTRLFIGFTCLTAGLFYLFSIPPITMGYGATDFFWAHRLFSGLIVAVSTATLIIDNTIGDNN